MKANQSAFPTQSVSDYAHGLSKRDYIAIEAMKALIGLVDEKDQKYGSQGVRETIARGAYALADALIAESEKQ